MDLNFDFRITEYWYTDWKANDGVSHGESVRNRRHRPKSHAPHDDSYGPQLYVPAGCSGEVAAWWTIPMIAMIKNSSR